MKLSKYFTLDEMTHSNYATRHVIDNTPNKSVIDNLKYGCVNVLDRVREHVGIIHVSSGYRSKALNSAIGGRQKSQHMKGEAADIWSSTKKPRQLAKAFIDANTDYDQLIVEFDRWLHVSWTKHGSERKHLLYAYKEGGKTKYRHMTYNELEG